MSLLGHVYTNVCRYSNLSKTYSNPESSAPEADALAWDDDVGFVSAMSIYVCGPGLGTYRWASRTTPIPWKESCGSSRNLNTCTQGWFGKGGGSMLCPVCVLCPGDQKRGSDLKYMFV